MILVTGGTGLVGSHVLYDLAKQGKQIRAIKRKSSSVTTVESVFRLYSPDADALLKNLEWVEGDVQDYLSLEEALIGIERVYHCAAMVSFNPKDQARMMKINVDGTANVVNACINGGVNKLCFVSSVAALGRIAENVVVDETCDWIESDDNSAYAKSKYAAEREVWRGIAEGLNAVIVNPSIIIGPGDPSKSSVQLLKQASQKNLFYTQGVNAFVDVRDVSRAMIELMDSDITGERFVLAGANCSYRELFNMMADGFGLSHPSIHVKPWMLGLVWRAAKILSLLTGAQPLITRETAQAAGKHYLYGSDKIKNLMGFEFTPIGQSISEHCLFFSRMTNTRRHQRADQ